MKIHFEHKSTVFEFELPPMEQERLNAVCKLVEVAIGGGVLLGAIALVGFWAIPWAVGALVAAGLYKLFSWLIRPA